MDGYRYLAIALENFYYTLGIGLLCAIIFTLYLYFSKTRSINDRKAIVLLLLLITLGTVITLAVDNIIWDSNLMERGIYLVTAPIYPVFFFAIRGMFHKEREANLGKYISVSVQILILTIVMWILAESFWI